MSGWGVHVVTRRYFVAAALVLVAGCSLDKQTAPPLAGPSELGLSLTISATPDSIQQDGSSISTVSLLVRDANSQPVRGLQMSVQTNYRGAGVDYGQLSAKVVSTGDNGRATVFYTAPPEQPATDKADSVVTVEFTPIGQITLPDGSVIPGNFAGQVNREVQIRLRPKGVIDLPGAAPKASFFFSPTAPRTEDDVFFDASASTGTIVDYLWNFGDGRTGSGKTARHHYDLPATYNVTLTVIDDKGRQNTTAPVQVTVANLTNPVADFVFSPTTPKQNQVVNFDAMLSKAEVGHTIVNYRWDFGDGGALFDTNGPTTQRIYAVGTHTITLQVTDDVGRKGTVSKTITVAP